ncbi:MAG: uL22 family ribosomal protein [Candidatus Aenigmatarchaeota archaeon]
MKQTFVPEHNYAKAFGSDIKISMKASMVLCNVIRGKPLTRARRLLEDLIAQRRSLHGKYYTKAAKGIIILLSSCEKNAEFRGLDMNRLFVHASAHKGTNIRRRRRKGAFGSKLKSTNMEIMLVERGKQPSDIVSKKKIKEQLTKKSDAEVNAENEKEELKRDLDVVKNEQKQLKKDVEEAEQKV